MIYNFLFYEKGLKGSVFQGHSPLTLSELGIRILEESGGKDYVDENRNRLIAEIANMSPKCELDVQYYSYSVLTKKTGEESFIRIKNFVYQNPVFRSNDEKPFLLDLEMATHIMSFYLRDLYLASFSKPLAVNNNNEQSMPLS